MLWNSFGLLALLYVSLWLPERKRTPVRISAGRRHGQAMLRSVHPLRNKGRGIIYRRDNLELSKRQHGDLDFTRMYLEYLRTQARIKKPAELLKMIANMRSNDYNLEESFNPSGFKMEDQWEPLNLNQTCIDWLQSYRPIIGNDNMELHQEFNQQICPLFVQMIKDLKLFPLLES